LGIIFCNSRRDADSIARNLQKNGINATALHGGLTQNRREQIMQDFHKGITEILVATDVAGRGLDIKNVTHIFNYGIPKNVEDYANRIGRTARAGETGVAISFLSRDDHDLFRRILRTFSHNIEKMEVPHFKIIAYERHEYHDENSERGFGRQGFGRRRFSRRPFRRGYRRY
jgi:superfamily II DNA/RNA helicase